MPNHITNELVFKDVDQDTQKRLLEKICNEQGEVDFNVLVPMPLNIWQGNVGRVHERTFQQNGLDWSRKNWGTKWNAYSQKVTQTDNTLIIQFDTAWKPPYPWLAAVFNFFKVSFEHRWQDEGCTEGYCGRFDSSNNRWHEEQASDELQIHLNTLGLWSNGDE